MTPPSRPGITPFTLSRRPGFRRLQRAVLFIVGEHQLTGPCAAAFTARF
jgi:hypothetical protein